MEFNPERLTLARERRGLTKADLADRLNVVPRTIVNYEESKFTPDDDTIKKLALVLNFPVKFFFKRDFERPDFETTASFRSLTGVAAKYKNQAFSAGTIATEIHDWIDHHCDLPNLNVPNLPDADPEDASIIVRQAWGLGIKPIPNMIHLLEEHGVKIFSLPPDHSNEIDAYCVWYRKMPFVFLNTHTSVERSRFDCGHELAHLVLDRIGVKHGAQTETRAHRFSAAFLMPKDDLVLHKPDLITVQSLMELKKRYGVSITALAVRLHHLGFITDWQYRNVMVQLSRYRKQEPQPMIKRERSAVIEKVSNFFGGSRALITRLSNELYVAQIEISSLMFGLAAIDTTSTGSDNKILSKPLMPNLRLIK